MGKINSERVINGVENEISRIKHSINAKYEERRTLKREIEILENEKRKLEDFLHEIKEEANGNN